jgi:phage shock protein PspC (stress-responsive transcriptional regulator)
MHTTTHRLYRSKTDAIIGGVAGGLADYAGIASTIIRIFWILFTLAGGAGVLAYLLAWAIIPDEDGRHTILPLLLLLVVIVLPFILALLWIIPVTVTSTR